MSSYLGASLVPGYSMRVHGVLVVTGPGMAVAHTALCRPGTWESLHEHAAAIRPGLEAFQAPCHKLQTHNMLHLLALVSLHAKLCSQFSWWRGAPPTSTHRWWQVVHSGAWLSWVPGLARAARKACCMGCQTGDLGSHTKAGQTVV